MTVSYHHIIISSNHHIISSYHYIIISPYHYIIISPYHHITISSYHHITISSYQHISISSYHHSITSVLNIFLFSALPHGRRVDHFSTRQKLDGARGANIAPRAPSKKLDVARDIALVPSNFMLQPE